MMRAGAALLALALCTPALAQENDDLSRIPDAVQNAPAEDTGHTPAATAHGRYYIEDALGVSALRGDLAIQSPSMPSHWTNRTSFDALDRWPLGEGLSVSVSDRFDLIETEGIGFPAGAARNDLREAYLTWEPLAQTYLEFGRINFKNGIALGFNPTDFFKARTAVSQASSDPSALRENRLGTVMLRAQTIWEGGSATIAYAPRLQRARSLAGDAPGWIDPLFDRTNTAERFLLGLNFDMAGISAQTLLYHDGSRTKLGLDLSYPIGRSIIAYAEWAGGNDENLITRAIQFGKATGTLPGLVPAVPPASSRRIFQDDIAIGASWTSEAKVTVNLEYHFHQAGFSAADWRNWFGTGAANPALGPELWYIRAYASDMQELMSRHQVFLRADWQDAFITDLELSGISLVNPADGSATVQLAAAYNASSTWTIGAFAGGNFGGSRSEWASLPESGSLIVQAIRYF